MNDRGSPRPQGVGLIAGFSFPARDRNFCRFSNVRRNRTSYIPTEPRPMRKYSGTIRSLKFPWQDRKRELDEQSRVTSIFVCYGDNLDIPWRCLVLVADCWHVARSGSPGARFFLLWFLSQGRGKMGQGRQGKHPRCSPSAHRCGDVAVMFARMMQLPIICYRLEKEAAGISLGLVTS